MADVHYDAIVVGAGVMGSACAYKLTTKLKPGSKVLLVEQFDLLHKNGSSHGNSRICRYAYDESIYARMGVESIKQWREIQQLANTQVYYQTGGLDFGASDARGLNKVINVSKEIGFEHEELSYDQLVNRYPLMSGIPANYKGCYQPDAGIIDAQKAVDMFHQLCRKSTDVVCDIHDNEQIIAIREENNLVYVTTTKQNYTTNKLVLTCGAWISDIVKKNFGLELKLTAKRVSFYYWKVYEQYHEQFMKMPIFLHSGSDPYNPDFKEDVNLGYYGFGMFEKPGYIKVGIHDTLAEEGDVDPTQRAIDLQSGVETRVPERKIELCRKFVSGVYAGTIEYESYEDMYNNGHIVTCLYTCTPTGDFIIDKIPNSNNIIIGSPCSGHGFKMGTVVGEMLAELTTEDTPKDLFMGQFLRSKFSIQQIL